VDVLVLDRVLVVDFPIQTVERIHVTFKPKHGVEGVIGKERITCAQQRRAVVKRQEQRVCRQASRGIGVISVHEDRVGRNRRRREARLGLVADEAQACVERDVRRQLVVQLAHDRIALLARVQPGHVGIGVTATEALIDRVGDLLTDVCRPAGIEISVRRVDIVVGDRTPPGHTVEEAGNRVVFQFVIFGVLERDQHVASLARNAG